MLENENDAQNDAQKVSGIENEAQNDAQKVLENENDAQNDAQKVLENESDAQNDAQKVLGIENDGPNKSIEDLLIDLIKKNPAITRKEMAIIINKSKPTIERILKKSKKIKYIGSSKSGHWKIVE